MKKIFNVAGHFFYIEAGADFQLWEMMGESYGPFETNCPEGEYLFGIVVGEPIRINDKSLVYSNIEDSESEFVRFSVHRADNGDCYFEIAQPFSHYINAHLSISSDFSLCVLNLYGSVTEQWQTLNTAVNLCYHIACVRNNTIVLHASSVEYKGRAYLFLGKSGTGKSTHARMWKKALDEVILINDDHPILRVQEGNVMVYGSPWSGKTRCYKNIRFPLGGIIRIARAPYNKVHKLSVIESYASLVASCGGMTWDRNFADNRDSIIQDIIASAPCWKMECLPDEEAAIECSSAVAGVWK